MGKSVDLIGQDVRETEPVYIGRCLKPGVWEGIPTAFDIYGVNILKQCLEQKLDVIVMDELGFFENNAFIFQSMVHDILDLPIPVIGVIKDASTAFLDSIRERSDVDVLRVTKRNRDFIASYIKKVLYDEIFAIKNLTLNTKADNKFPELQ